MYAKLYLGRFLLLSGCWMVGSLQIMTRTYAGRQNHYRQVCRRISDRVRDYIDLEKWTYAADGP